MEGIQNITSLITNTNASSGIPSHCKLPPEPRGSILFRVTALTCIMLMSLIGNGLVCRGAMRRHKRPFSYYLVTNLAVAELVFTMTQPIHLVYNTEPHSWIFGSFMCHVAEPLTQCTTLVITFTLAAIAVYRCVMMLQPYTYCGRSSHVASTIIAISWIWGIVLSLPDSLTRIRTKPFSDCDLFLCENSEELPGGYRVAIFILNFVVPFITMVVSYSSVICRVMKHIGKTREPMEMYSTESLRTRSSILSTDVKHHPQTRDKESPHKPSQKKSVPIPNSPARLASQQNNPPSKKMLRLEADVLNMIYIVILLFFLCYLPSNVLFILTEGFGLQSIKYWPDYWLMISYLGLLHTVPSALHPICYGANSRVLGLFGRCSCRRRLFRK